MVGRYRERIGKGTEIVSFLDEVEKRLALPEIVAKYEDAVRANKKAEARALADQLLAQQDLPPELRSYLEQSRKASGK